MTFRHHALALALVAASAVPAIASDKPLSVWVSIIPQEEMVRRLAGPEVSVNALVQPGHSPATYEPTPKQLATLAEADLLVRARVPFERSLVATVSELAPRLMVVDSCRGIELAPIEEGHGHSHGEERLDPHVWLDPVLVSLQAATVCEALCETRPDSCERFRAGLKEYQADLEAVHRSLQDLLAPLAGRELFVFHPAYGYLARRYGLSQVAVERGGKAPTARGLASLIDSARSAGAGAIFVQPQFASGSAHAVADAIGVELVELDPLAANHLANLELMAERIAAAYGERGD